MPTRRHLLQSLLALAGSAPLAARAAGPLHRVSRELARELARAYALGGERRTFDRLFDLQSAFRGLDAWPQTDLVVSDAVSALRRVLDGESLPRAGFRSVVRVPGSTRAVVLSDHHALPAAHRQSGVWLANRDLLVRVLRWYADEGFTVVENGDVEDLVVLEPAATLAAYDGLLATRERHRFRPYELLHWFREDPLGLRVAIGAARLPHRRAQLDAIRNEPGNRAYYDLLAELAKAGQLVRLAGNHDAVLADLPVEAHLRPDDVLVIETDPPTAVLHGHQFDAATNPAVAPFYGEVVSECLGVWYQGADRTWSRAHAARILAGGFPNRLSTHRRTPASPAAALLQALFTNRAADDEEWAAAWEALFGHPIAWEYGAHDWSSAVRSPIARPAEVVEDAMSGHQFFKYRHLDEWMLVQELQRWNVAVNLVLGHSHEVRSHTFGPKNGNYYNGGAVGRFEGLLWGLEIDGTTPEVVAWALEPDETLRAYRFAVRDADLFTYFEATRDGRTA